MTIEIGFFIKILRPYSTSELESLAVFNWPPSDVSLLKDIEKIRGFKRGLE